MTADASGTWTPLVASAEVTKQPQRIVLAGVALVVWRAARGRPAVFIDRCPHKDFPLSSGRRTFFGRLVCDAHGWEFVADGTCVRAPGRPWSEVAGRHASVVECREAGGQLWVRTTPEGTPLVG